MDASHERWIAAVLDVLAIEDKKVFQPALPLCLAPPKGTLLELLMKTPYGTRRESDALTQALCDYWWQSEWNRASLGKAHSSLRWDQWSEIRDALMEPGAKREQYLALWERPSFPEIKRAHRRAILLRRTVEEGRGGTGMEILTDAGGDATKRTPKARRALGASAAKSIPDDWIKSVKQLKRCREETARVYGREGLAGFNDAIKSRRAGRTPPPGQTQWRDALLVGWCRDCYCLKDAGEIIEALEGKGKGYKISDKQAVWQAIQDLELKTPRMLAHGMV